MLLSWPPMVAGNRMNRRIVLRERPVGAVFGVCAGLTVWLGMCDVEQVAAGETLRVTGGM